MPHRQAFIARFLAEVKYSLNKVKSLHLLFFFHPNIYYCKCILCVQLLLVETSLYFKNKLENTFYVHPVYFQCLLSVKLKSTGQTTFFKHRVCMCPEKHGKSWKKATGSHWSWEVLEICSAQVKNMKCKAHSKEN